MKTTNITRKSNNTGSPSAVASQPRPIWQFTAALSVLLSLFLLGVAHSQAQVVGTQHSIWDSSTIPAYESFADSTSVELGLRFRSTADGYITAIRFYKGPANPGPHVGTLWTSDGLLLESALFESETDLGWQEQALPTPILISANTTYVVSYHAPSGGYAVNTGYFASAGVNNPPLEALQDGADGSNGIFAYNPVTTFPNGTFGSANYWVDVVFTVPVPVSDTTPPTITCPADVILQCANCDTDPSNTGTATATDETSVTVTYQDFTSGACPKVTKRFWTATDAAGNIASCVQTITCLPPSLVTDGSGAIFDRDASTSVQDFRLLFIQDPQNWPCYRLVASNPGQTFYNVFYTGTPGQQVTFNITVPYPFVTQGAVPIHAYDWVTVTGSGASQGLTPGNEFSSSSQLVKLSTYGKSPAASTTIPVTLTVPASGVVYLVMHLDYGLKGTTGYTQNFFADAVDCATGTKVLVPNHGTYAFSVAGAQNGANSIQNINAFKKIPGVAGLVLHSGTMNPVEGATVTLANASRVAVGSDVTDEDGFYMIPYKHTGKAATYYVSLVTLPLEGFSDRKTITLKANAFVRQDFLVP